MEKQNKKHIRKSCIEKRDRLTPVTRARGSAMIRQRVFRHSAWVQARTVLIYVSFRTEVETLPLIKKALALNKRVVVPIVDPESKELTLSQLNAAEDLMPGSFYGISEPASSKRKAVNASEIELVLAPGAAFDRKGGRIGMGGGYFDKLLLEMPEARRIGLAYSEQVVDHPLPLEPHDIPMHTVVTEKEVIEATLAPSPDDELPDPEPEPKPAAKRRPKEPENPLEFLLGGGNN